MHPLSIITIMKSLSPDDKKSIQQQMSEFNLRAIAKEPLSERKGDAITTDAECDAREKAFQERLGRLFVQIEHKIGTLAHEERRKMESTIRGRSPKFFEMLESAWQQDIE